MADSPPSKKSSIGCLLWIPVGLFVIFFISPSLLTWWPPASVERHTQKQKLTERVQLAGGWDAIRRDCVSLAEQHANGFNSRWRDTNLPPAIVALKPLLVEYEPSRGRVSMRIFGLHSTGGHSTPYFGLEVVTEKIENHETGTKYSSGENYHFTTNEVSQGNYEIY